jgi:hypothetical protein
MYNLDKIFLCFHHSINIFVPETNNTEKRGSHFEKNRQQNNLTTRKERAREKNKKNAVKKENKVCTP